MNECFEIIYRLIQEKCISCDEAYKLVKNIFENENKVPNYNWADDWPLVRYRDIGDRPDLEPHITCYTK